MRNTSLDHIRHPLIVAATLAVAFIASLAAVPRAAAGDRPDINTFTPAQRRPRTRRRVSLA